MSIITVLILGLIQGLTEFIPVSSSGHLELATRFLSSSARPEDFHLFLELINFGTLLALLIYYRKQLWRILIDIFKNHNFKMARNLILTSVPAGLIGLLLSKFIESADFFSSLITISIALGIIGIIMIFADKLPHLSTLKSEQEITAPRAFLIGLIQTFALIPGVSRSGSTILAGRMMGLDSKSSADYSFLASIPIMLAVCAKSLLSSSSREYIMENLSLLALSNAVAFIFGLLSLYLVMKFLKKKNTLAVFGYYRVILASVVLLVVLFIKPF